MPADHEGRRRLGLAPAIALTLTAALIGLLAYGLIRGGNGKTLDDAIKRGELPTAPSSQLPLERLQGRGTLNLESLRGQIVVLNFWAHWCEPCRAEAPVLNRIHTRLQNERLGTVLGASYDDPPVDALRFARENKLKFPLVADVGTRLARAFGTNKLPETFVIDRQGRITAVSRGEVAYDFLDRAVTSAARP